MNSRNMVWGGIALVALIVVLAWGGGWFGDREPSTTPTATTGQPAGEPAPAN